MNKVDAIFTLSALSVHAQRYFHPFWDTTLYLFFISLLQDSCFFKI